MVRRNDGQDGGFEAERQRVPSLNDGFQIRVKNGLNLRL